DRNQATTTSRRNEPASISTNRRNIAKATTPTTTSPDRQMFPGENSTRTAAVTGGSGFFPVVMDPPARCEPSARKLPFHPAFTHAGSSVLAGGLTTVRREKVVLGYSKSSGLSSVSRRSSCS